MLWSVIRDVTGCGWLQGTLRCRGIAWASRWAPQCQVSEEEVSYCVCVTQQPFTKSTLLSIKMATHLQIQTFQSWGDSVLDLK